MEIESIEAQWHTPDGQRFRVRTLEGMIFELVYDQIRDEWQIDLV